MAGGVVGLIGVVAALLWFVWLPEYRPGLKRGERYGIDVSHHQGDIAWGRVAGDDIDFAYLKATEGGDLTDALFRANWDGAAAAGLDRGAYHFFTLCTPGEAQARHFLEVVPDDADALPPAVDLEIAGNCSDRPDNETVQSELRQFLDLIEAETRQQVTVYVGDDFERRYPVRETLDQPIWHRRILLRPDIEGWLIWQVTGSAHVEGISGDVDLDVMRAPS
ncbi:MAG TPA: GH25 family lysozyme [Acidimicrobiales bacterium]